MHTHTHTHSTHVHMHMRADAHACCSHTPLLRREVGGGLHRRDVRLSRLIANGLDCLLDALVSGRREVVGGKWSAVSGRRLVVAVAACSMRWPGGEGGGGGGGACVCVCGGTWRSQ